MEVKAIALDIDGTLTDDSKRITPRTKEALLEAERKGVRLILASGRPAHGLRRIARELELESHGGMLLAYNGAQIRDAATGELLFDQPMSEGDARAVLAHMREFDVIPMLVDGDRLYVEDAYRCEIFHKGVAKNIIKYERDMCDLRVHEVHDIVGWCRLPQDKVLVAGTDTYLAEHHAEMAARLPTASLARSRRTSTSSSRRRGSTRPTRSERRCPSVGSISPRSSPSGTARTTQACSPRRGWASPWATRARRRGARRI